MVLFRDVRRLEVTVEEHDGLWIAKLQAFIPDRLYSTTYLLQSVTTRQAAIEAVRRKWRLLFPDEDALVWHDPVTASPSSPSHRPRSPQGREA